MTRSWRRYATWAALSLYLLTGPVVAAVHFEPDSLSSGGPSRSAFRAPGEGARHLPVDQSHTCVICMQLTERVTTPAVPCQISALDRVQSFCVHFPAIRPAPARYISPDKRGPPPATV